MQSVHGTLALYRIPQVNRLLVKRTSERVLCKFIVLVQPTLPRFLLCFPHLEWFRMYTLDSDQTECQIEATVEFLARPGAAASVSESCCVAWEHDCLAYHSIVCRSQLRAM